jgi:hypothetical protein
MNQNPNLLYLDILKRYYPKPYAESKWAIHGYMNSVKAEMPWLQSDLTCPGPITIVPRMKIIMY